MREPLSSSLTRPVEGDALHVLVDFSLLRSDGENGGLKHFLLGLFAQLGSRAPDQLRFTYLVDPGFHRIVKGIQRPGDRIVSVRPCAHPLDVLPGTWRTGDYYCPSLACDYPLQWDVDVMYAPMPSLEFVCAGVPLVALVADLLHRDLPASCGSEEAARREAIWSQLAGTANRFHCISRFTASRLEHHYPATKGRTFVAHIARDGIAEPVDRHVRPQNSPDFPYFYYPANAWPHKNHLALLTAYRAYRDLSRTPPWPLVLTGHCDANMRKVLRAIDTLGLQGHVHYLGYVGEPEQAYVWSNSGALVFPSQYEGFGMPLVEAMRHYVPIIANRAAALPEIAGEAALLVDMDEPGALALAMDQFVASTDLRRALAEKGRQRAGQFSAQAESAKIFQALLAAASEPAAPWYRGPLGSGDGRSVAALPWPEEARTGEIHFRCSQGSARVRLYQDKAPLGSALLAPGSDEIIRVRIPGGVQSLTVEPLGPVPARLTKLIVSNEARGDRHVLFDSGADSGDSSP